MKQYEMKFFAEQIKFIKIVVEIKKKMKWNEIKNNNKNVEKSKKKNK